MKPCKPHQLIAFTGTDADIAQIKALAPGWDSMVPPVAISPQALKMIRGAGLQLGQDVDVNEEVYRIPTWTGVLNGVLVAVKMGAAESYSGTVSALVRANSQWKPGAGFPDGDNRELDDSVLRKLWAPVPMNYTVPE